MYQLLVWQSDSEYFRAVWANPELTGEYTPVEEQPASTAAVGKCRWNTLINNEPRHSGEKYKVGEVVI